MGKYSFYIKGIVRGASQVIMSNIFTQINSRLYVGLFSACLIGMAIRPLPASSAVIYHDDFSDVSDWEVVFNNLGGVATVTSDGSWASFYVAGANNLVAFAPISGVTPLPSFNIASTYRMTYAVQSLTYSTSYSIEIDQFDANTNYLATAFGVVPQGVILGTNTVSLEGIAWNINTEYVLPKITVYTGDGNQTVVFDFLDVYPIPEPSSLVLLAMGAMTGIGLVRRRSKKGRFGRITIQSTQRGVQ